jgi:hypothetical protein
MIVNNMMKSINLFKNFLLITVVFNTGILPQFNYGKNPDDSMVIVELPEGSDLNKDHSQSLYKAIDAAKEKKNKEKSEKNNTNQESKNPQTNLKDNGKLPDQDSVKLPKNSDKSNDSPKSNEEKKDNPKDSENTTENTNNTPEKNSKTDKYLGIAGTGAGVTGAVAYIGRKMGDKTPQTKKTVAPNETDMSLDYEQELQNKNTRKKKKNRSKKNQDTDQTAEHKYPGNILQESFISDQGFLNFSEIEPKPLHSPNTYGQNYSRPQVFPTSGSQINSAAQPQYNEHEETGTVLDVSYEEDRPSELAYTDMSS